MDNFYFTYSIGFAIARSLGENGAKVIVSSRKEERVMNAVKLLKDEGLEVRGTVCHVGKAEDRKKLVDLVSIFPYLLSLSIEWAIRLEEV